MSNRFAMTFTALPEHIDENGHVNNTVWVRWMEDIAIAHPVRGGEVLHPPHPYRVVDVAVLVDVLRQRGEGHGEAVAHAAAYAPASRFSSS